MDIIDWGRDPSRRKLRALGVNKIPCRLMVPEDLLEEILQLAINDNLLNVEMEPEEDSSTLPHMKASSAGLLVRLELVTS